MTRVTVDIDWWAWRDLLEGWGDGSIDWDAADRKAPEALIVAIDDALDAAGAAPPWAEGRPS